MAASETSQIGPFFFQSSLCHAKFLYFAGGRFWWRGSCLPPWLSRRRPRWKYAAFSYMICSRQGLISTCQMLDSRKARQNECVGLAPVITFASYDIDEQDSVTTSVAGYVHGDENIRLGWLKSLLTTNHSDPPALLQISFEASGGSGAAAAEAAGRWGGENKARRGVRGEEGKARRGGESAARRGERGEEGRSRRGRESAARRDVNVMRMEYSRDVFALLHQGQQTFVFWLHCCDARAKIYTNIRLKTWKKWYLRDINLILQFLADAKDVLFLSLRIKCWESFQDFAGTILFLLLVAP